MAQEVKSTIIPIWIKVLALSLCLILLAGCREAILHDLNESDANRVVTRLNEFNVVAEKIKQADGKWTVSVDKTDAIPALKHLSDTRLFRDIAPPALSKSGMISSREDQRFKFERALSAEIEHTLGSIDGVLETRVHLNLPPRDPLFGETLGKGAQGSASVLIVASSEFKLEKAAVSELVAGASGVAKEAVSVLITPSGALEVETNPIVEKIAALPEAVAVATTPVATAVTTTGMLGKLGLSRDLLIQISISFIILGIGALYFVFSTRFKRARKVGQLNALFPKASEGVTSNGV